VTDNTGRMLEDALIDAVMSDHHCSLLYYSLSI